MRFLMLWLAMVFFAGCSKKPIEVSVMTFNIRYINMGDQGARAWVNRRDAVAALMQAQQGDFIGLQEAFRPMIDHIHERMPGYGEIGVGRENGKEKGEYAAILYKQKDWEALEHGTFWLSDTPEVVASSTWGNKVTRICTWGLFQHKHSSRKLYVYNAHFDHESQMARENGAALVLQRIRKHDRSIPVIFTGDLNAAPENPAIQQITAHESALRDVWAVVHGAASPGDSGTVHGFEGRRNGARIDYIFATPELTPRSAMIHYDQRDGNYPSDHFPVSTRLVMP
jgi:endonuclease/exonuclease/phosphatase family metal-dependent hydrolase